MGYTWTKNPVAVTRKGVKVYHIFDNDDADNGILRVFWFGLSANASDDGDDSFDVRELPNWRNPESLKAEPEHIKNILREAIDLGLIYKDGDETKIKGA